MLDDPYCFKILCKVIFSNPQYFSIIYSDIQLSDSHLRLSVMLIVICNKTHKVIHNDLQ